MRGAFVRINKIVALCAVWTLTLSPLAPTLAATTPAVKPATTKTVAKPVAKPAAKPAPIKYVKTPNLFKDNGFEKVFTTTDPTVQLVTQKPIAGKASLQITVGNKKTVSLDQSIGDLPNTKATSLAISAKVRPDLKTTANVQLCGVAAYTNKTTVSRCTTLSKTINKVTTVNITVPLTNTKQVASLHIVVKSLDAKAGRFTVDSVSGILTIPSTILPSVKAVLAAPPTPVATTTNTTTAKIVAGTKVSDVTGFGRGFGVGSTAGGGGGGGGTPASRSATPASSPAASPSPTPNQSIPQSPSPAPTPPPASAPAQVALHTYYLSPNGSDSANCAQTTPCRQAARALALAVPGDLILFADGTYASFTVDSKIGTVLSPITLKAQGAGANIAAGARDTIFITDSAYIVVDGLRALNAVRAGIRVSNSPHVTVRNGVFGNSGTWGIFTDFTDDLLLESNDVYGSVDQHGIYVSNSSQRPLIRGNVVHDNHDSGIQINADVTMGGEGITHGAVIENNIIYNNGTGGGGSINLDGVQDSIVRNNVLYGNHNTGIANWQYNGAAGPKNMQFLNNTVVQANDGRQALQLRSSAGGTNIVRNNILIHPNAARAGLELDATVDLTNYAGDYNILDRVSYNGNLLTLAAFKAQASGQEAHSLSATVANLFTDSANNNFTLKSGSPAVDAGINVALVATDILGATRPAGTVTDIGAYEYGGSGGVTPPADTNPVGTTPVTPVVPAQEYVNIPPTISITLPSNGATYTAPASISISANASDSDGSITSVSFYRDGSLVATDSSAPFTASLASVAVGSYALTARATDSSGAITTSVAVTITVNAAAQTPAPAPNPSPNPNPAPTPPPTPVSNPTPAVHSASYRGTACIAPTVTYAAGDGSSAARNSTYTLELTGSGSPVLLPASNSLEPSEPGLTQPLTITRPNAQCPTMLGRVIPHIAIPRNSNIRSIEGFWNGTRLPLKTVFNTSQDRLLDEGHSYGPQQIPFNTPLYALDTIPAGDGTLEIRGYDANYRAVASVKVNNLHIDSAPTPVSVSSIAGTAHPRLLLTASRLANAKAKMASNDVQAQGYKYQLNRFLTALNTIPDPNSAAFNNEIYYPRNYIPLLGLCYQLNKVSDPATATKCANAGRSMVMNIVAQYSGADQAAQFSRDTGYDIRLGHYLMMIGYDWLYDTFTASQRSQIVNVATVWVDWYTNSGLGYAVSRPANNYYGPYIQAMAFTAVSTAGENAASQRLLDQLRGKLTTEMSVANQLACGGDWPEGGNYGPDAMFSSMNVQTVLADYGEDWSPVFEWMQPQALVYRYQITPDGSQMLPFGGFSGNKPHKTSPALLSALSTQTSFGAFSSGLYNFLKPLANNDLYDASGGDTTYELIFGDITQNPSVSGLSKTCYAAGSGRFFSKSSLTDTSGYQVATENMNYAFDHFGYANGDVRFFHGGTCILCASTYRGNFSGEESTPAFSTYQANGANMSYVPGRNNQVLFVKETATFNAIGMRFESSFATDRFDENIFADNNPLDYMIREVVHVQPGILVIRDLHRRRHSTDTLIAHFHLGPSGTQTSLGNNFYRVGNVTIGTWTSAPSTITFGNSVDQGGATVGRRMDIAFPATTAAMEAVTVLSDTGIILSSYANGLATLSNGQCVAFANGTVDVYTCDGRPLPEAPPPANVAPSASAGSSQSITLPNSTVTLSGSGTDSDGSISSYRWAQTSGPNTATLSSVTSPSLTASNLVAGTYVFTLTVTDNGGLTGSASATVTVNAAPAQAPNPAPAPSPSPSPNPSPAPVPAPSPNPPPLGATTGNLLPNADFEINQSPGFAAYYNDTAVRSTVNPISGSASLQVYITGYDSVWYVKDVTGSATMGRGSQVKVTAKARYDVASAGILNFCAAVYYVGDNHDTGTATHNCTQVPQAVGQISNLSATVTIDPTRDLREVDIQLQQAGQAVTASFDEMTLELLNPTSASQVAGQKIDGVVAPQFLRQLVMGDTGSDVTTLQLFLQNVDLLKAGVPLGYFGTLTSQALAAYQVIAGLKATGVVDAATLTHLNSL